jgi:hypothetical protein
LGVLPPRLPGDGEAEFDAKRSFSTPLFNHLVGAQQK